MPLNTERNGFYMLHETASVFPKATDSAWHFSEMGVSPFHPSAHFFFSTYSCPCPYLEKGPYPPSHKTCLTLRYARCGWALTSSLNAPTPLEFFSCRFISSSTQRKNIPVLLGDNVYVGNRSFRPFLTVRILLCPYFPTSETFDMVSGRRTENSPITWVENFVSPHRERSSPVSPIRSTPRFQQQPLDKNTSEKENALVDASPTLGSDHWSIDGLIDCRMIADAQDRSYSRRHEGDTPEA